MYVPEKLRHFVDGVSQVSWEHVYASHCPDDTYEHFIKKFIELFNQMFPYQYIKSDNKTKKCPYLTFCLIKSIKEKTVLHAWRKNGL